MKAAFIPKACAHNLNVQEEQNGQVHTVEKPVVLKSLLLCQQKIYITLVEQNRRPPQKQVSACWFSQRVQT